MNSIAEPNPFLGVVLHAIGGLAAASFYIPYKQVRHWAWETYWLVGGFFSWIIAPWVLALVLVPHAATILSAVPGRALFWTYFFGVLWGIGGLTFGLTMRYLGIALGYAIALGFCAAFGTLMPPIYNGQIGGIVHSSSGQIVLFGVAVCLAGIVVSGGAGVSKERELSTEQKQAAVREFSFWKGLMVAVFCGVMSACMSYAFAAGKPIAALAVARGAPSLWQNLPVLVVALAGGFTTNVIWCVLLHLKNRTGREYLRSMPGNPAERVPLVANYLFCGLAGVTWYLQFFFYSMGTTKMGRYDFSSWTLHMASIIIFSTLWGVALKEWRGTSRRTHVLIGFGLAVLIASTIVVGYGNYRGLAPVEKEAGVWLGDLRCEYRRDPLGIDSARPRLSWVLESAERGERQTAYQVLVSTSPGLLTKDSGDLWDSGKVMSDRSCQVEYDGPRLASAQRCVWKVRVWDRSGHPSAWSRPAAWTMGLLKPEDWRAQWVRYVAPVAKGAGQWIWYPEEGGLASASAPAEPRFFVKTVEVTDAVERAQVKVSCDNAFELYVNGAKLAGGDDWQSAAVCNIARHLAMGRNVIAIIGRNTLPGPAGLFVKGSIVLKDGQTISVVSDSTWQVSKTESARWLEGDLENAKTAQVLGGYGIAPWNEEVRNLEESDAPSPWLRKTFDLESAPDRALAYVNSLGFHELYVNGRRVDAHVLTPAVSQFSARSLYVTYDIAPLLRKGRNCIGLWLGRGWRLSGPMVRFQADIVAGGRHVEIVSDDTWKCAPSSYVSLTPYFQHGGERYDARKDNPLWGAAECDDSGWGTVQKVAPPGSRAESQPCPLNRIGQRIPPVTCKDLGSGRYQFDFGTNLAGWMRLRLPSLAAGQRVVIRYADIGDQTYGQADEFISAGRANEEFCSKFNYHGFRYATIEGLPSKPAMDDAEALLVESDLEPVGSFACSDDLLNRIERLNVWTLRCLDLGGYLVDCPHRERAGYGDGQVSAETCLMNFWMPGFYGKWLGDWRDSQNAGSGDMSHTAPSELAGGGGGPAWGGALPTLAWRTYLYYDDRRLLRECYDAMRRYVDHLESRCTNDVLRAYGGPWDFIGDWVAPGHGQGSPSCFLPTRVNEAFNNCYRVYLWDLLAKSAAALGREDEVARCQARLDQIRRRVHEEFYDPEKHTYVSEDQSYQCLPLFAGVTPASERGAVLKKLEDGIRVRRHGHLDTGMLGTYFLFQYLPTVQRDDLLYTIVAQTNYPGWGYMLGKGATTLWEEWEGGNSQIHSCFTSVGGWFHNGVAGIQPDPAGPGFKRIIIRPAPVGNVTWVKCRFRSMHGAIVSNWRHENGVFSLDVTIPANTTATVYLPTRDPKSITESGQAVVQANGVRYLRAENGYAVFAVDSGRYVFTAAL